MQTIVLIPGYMCDGNVWKNLKPELKKKNYKVIIPKFNRGKTIQEFAQQTLKLLPEQFSVVGFSMGGFVALNLAMNNPKRVQKLILVGSNGRAISKDRKSILNKSLADFNNRNYIKKFISNNYDKYFIKSNLENKSYINLISSMTKKHSYSSFKRQTNAILNRPNLLNQLRKVSVKTFIIAGYHDQLSPKDLNIELNKKIKNSKIKFIKKSGHFTMLEEPYLFNKEVINFLDL